MSNAVTGASTAAAIVGARQLDDRTLRIYRRVAGAVTADDHALIPWALVRTPSVVEGLSEPPESITPLEGPDAFQWMVTFRRWPLLWEAVQKSLAVESERRRQRLMSFVDLDDLFVLSDPVEQWLVATGSHFFADIPPTEPIQVQVAIQTAAPPGRPSRADRSQDRIQVIAATVHDGRKSVFRLRKSDESSLLTEFIKWISDVDPDFIEGHDLTTHLLPYLSTRCAMLSVNCEIGRDGTSLRFVSQPAGRSVWEVPGRTLIDLSETSRHVGPIVRAFLPPPRGRIRNTDLKKVVESPTLLQVCSEIRTRSDRHTRVAHALLGIVPMTPERFFRTGPGHWFESWLMRESYRSRRTFPSTERASAAAEGTEPNGMTGHFSPAAEIVIVPLKVKAFASVIDGKGPVPDWGRRAFAYWHDLLDSSRGSTWSRSGDPPPTLAPTILLTGLVDAVRARTSRLSIPSLMTVLDAQLEIRMRSIVARLSMHNIAVVQRSVDRLCVEIPDNLGGAVAEQAFWTRVSSDLPDGVKATPVRRMDALISLGPRILIGATDRSIIYLLRSHPARATEAFIREYHAWALDCILHRQWNRLQVLTSETLRRIRTRSWHVADFCRRETLTESLEDYERSKAEHRRNPAAAYEALLRAEETYQKERDRFLSISAGSTARPTICTVWSSPRKRPAAGTTVVYYVAGTRREQSVAEMSRLAEFWDPSSPDENTDYYVERLHLAAERYQILLEEADFTRVFSEESLFSFQDPEIKPVRRAFTGSDLASGGTGSGSAGIWLDTESA